MYIMNPLRLMEGKYECHVQTIGSQTKEAVASSVRDSERNMQMKARQVAMRMYCERLEAASCSYAVRGPECVVTRAPPRPYLSLCWLQLSQIAASCPLASSRYATRKAHCHMSVDNMTDDVLLHI